jgi:hypothetical protein
VIVLSLLASVAGNEAIPDHDPEWGVGSVSFPPGVTTSTLAARRGCITDSSKSEATSGGSGAWKRGGGYRDFFGGGAEAKGDCAEGWGTALNNGCEITRVTSEEVAESRRLQAQSGTINQRKQKQKLLAVSGPELEVLWDMFTN